jgi:hypothetical protein
VVSVRTIPASRAALSFARIRSVICSMVTISASTP